MEYKLHDTLLLSIGLRARTSSTRWTDLVGMVASLGCAVHCAAMPFVIGYLPTLGLTWMAGESFHRWMAVICAVIAFMAFIPGWKRHRRMAPALIGIVGIGLLSSAAFALEPCCETSLSAQDPPLHAGLNVSSCQACQTCVSATNADQPQTWEGRVRPYITPFGGFVLILAHLLNHRFGCQCCSGDWHCQSGED